MPIPQPTHAFDMSTHYSTALQCFAAMQLELCICVYVAVMSGANFMLFIHELNLYKTLQSLVLNCVGAVE